MNLKSVLSLCGIFLLLGFKEVISTSSLITDDRGECEFLNEEEDLCASYCYKSMKLGLGYIVELKENIKKLEQNYSERDNSQHNKAVEDIRSIIIHQNIHLAKQLKESFENLQRQTAKDKEDILAEQYNLKNKVEQILTDKKEKEEMVMAKNKQSRIIINLKREMKNLKEDLDRLDINLHESKKELESQRKQLEEYQTKGKNCSNEIKELNSEVSSLKEKLENSHTQLSESKYQADQLNQTEKNLAECLKMLPKNSCKGLSSGVYKIDIPVDPISALCEGNIEGGGWIVVHKRFNGSVDFNRNWSEYRNGFGNMEGEFFIGLENLHRITNSQTHELYVQLGFYNGSVLFASYDHFRIGNETMKYKLESLGEFKGTAVNAMVHSLGEVFSTFDRDNDQWVGGNCAKTFSGAWWYDNCSYVHLNGKYVTKLDCHNSYMRWWSCYSIKSAQMLIRPKQRWTSF